MRAMGLFAPPSRDQQRVDPAPHLGEPAVGIEAEPRRRAERAALQPENLEAVGVTLLPVSLPVVVQPA